MGWCRRVIAPTHANHQAHSRPQIGEDDLWRNVAYGTPLTVQDCDPYNAARQKMRTLFALIEDMRAGDPETDGSDGPTSSSSSAY